MDEKKLLEQFAQVLGPAAQEALYALENKKLKQLKMLEAFTASLSKVAQIEVSLSEEEKDRIINPEHYNKAKAEPLQESGKPDEAQLPVKDFVSPAAYELSKLPQKDIQQYADAIPNSIRKEIDLIKKAVADFHRFAQRHSQLGGGGEVRLERLDDVDYQSIKNATDGQALVWDAALKRWKAGSIIPGPGPGPGPSGTSDYFNERELFQDHGLVSDPLYDAFGVLLLSYADLNQGSRLNTYDCGVMP